jgi:hypothetical protein
MLYQWNAGGRMHQNRDQRDQPVEALRPRRTEMAYRKPRPSSPQKVDVKPADNVSDHPLRLPGAARRGCPTARTMADPT